MLSSVATMQIKARSVSPFRISSRRLFVCVLMLICLAILRLVSRLQQLSASTSQSDGLRSPLKSSGLRQNGQHVSDEPKVSSISKEQFNEKYAAKYKGLLPTSSSSERRNPDPSCGHPPDFFDFFRLPKSQRSRFHEDKIIYDTFFKNMALPSSPEYESPLPKGTYVELGAFDGREESNTMFFDRCLGWDGLLIEAQSQSYEKVIENRPNAVKLSYSPTCKEEDQVASFYDYPLSNNGIEDVALSYKGKSAIKVPCGPLTSVLLDVFGGAVSFLSLDVEGAESMVLDTVDFTKLRIDIVMVEVQNTHCPTGNCPQVHQIRKTMALANYVLFAEMLEAR